MKRKKKDKPPTKRNGLVDAMIKRHPRGGRMRHRSERRSKDTGKGWLQDQDLHWQKDWE